MRIALAQINTIIGDVTYNQKVATKFIMDSDEWQVDLVVLPEMLLTGYPPRDLLNRKDLIDQNLKAKNELVKLTENLKCGIVFGYVDRTNKDGQKPLVNNVVLAYKGKILQTRTKTLLPTYDVFEEYRYFEPGPRVFNSIDFTTQNGDNVKLGLVICEEAWNDKEFWKTHLYDVDPVSELVKNGANYLVVVNASPYRKEIIDTRIKMMAQHCLRHNVGACYVNQVGYNDEVGFDGNSFAINSDGELIAHSTHFSEDLLIFNTQDLHIPNEVYQFYVKQPWQEEVLTALITGVKDYFEKQNLKGPAIIGLSGGIDSAIVAYIAKQALGKDRVIGIGMPSKFSSSGSVEDARKIAQTLGIHFVVEPIKQQHDAIRVAVDNMNVNLLKRKEEEELFREKDPVSFQNRTFKDCEDSGITDENIQARLRGLYLMALSNYYGGLVLSTGNKSEMAVGYCTLYGDMCGGLAVISDVPKTMVYDLCRYINDISRAEIIPKNTIEKPPSAELRANQKDQDSLPPYWLLDMVLYQYVDEGKCHQEVLESILSDPRIIGYNDATSRDLVTDILWVCDAITKSEFKRKQAPTGLKISHKHFKYGWTQPIVHRLGNQ